MVQKLGKCEKYYNFSGEGRRKKPADICRYSRPDIVKWVSTNTGISKKKTDLVMRGIEEFFILAAAEDSGVQWNNFFAMRIYNKGENWKSPLYDKFFSGVTYVRFTNTDFMKRAKGMVSERYTDNSIPEDIRELTPSKKPLPKLDLRKVNDKFGNNDIDTDDIVGDNMTFYMVCRNKVTGELISKTDLPQNLLVGDINAYKAKLNRNNIENEFDVEWE